MAGTSPAGPVLITATAAPRPRLSDASGYAAIPCGPRFDPDLAHPARVYGYPLGGKDHCPADRTAAEEVIRQRPQVVAGARANRAFLARVVRYLASRRSVGQFLDIGCGLPAPGGAREVAQALAPRSRVVYVDNDPLVLSAVAACNRLVPAGVTARSHAQVTAFFGGLSLVAPGIVPVAEWRREIGDPFGQPADLYAGLAVTGRRWRR
jgi:hypothetical protein